MSKQQLTLYRIVFLATLSAVFLFTYLADINIFAVVLEALTLASPYAENFLILFLILSLTALSVYYYFIQLNNQEVLTRLFAWLKIFSFSVLVSVFCSSMAIYVAIANIKTFDIY